MRKLNFILGLAAMGMVIFMGSCSKEDAKGPGIDLQSDAEVTAPANSSITIEWTAYAGDANLKYFTITEGNSPITGWDEYEIPSSENENFTSSATVAVGESNTTFTLTVTDKDGLTASKTVTVTVESSTPLTAKGTSELGAGGSTLGSYYSVSSDVVYKTTELDQAKANTVDFVFDSDASSAVFKSPKDAVNTLVKNSGRTTNYQKVTLDFDNATEEAIADITPSADNITVSQGDIIVFKTQDNTKGVFKVNSLTVADNGTVIIDIKIKQ